MRYYPGNGEEDKEPPFRPAEQRKKKKEESA